MCLTLLVLNMAVAAGFDYTVSSFYRGQSGRRFRFIIPFSVW